MAMAHETDYEAINRAKWDERAPVHAATREYGVAQYIADAAFIGPIVQFDVPLLGDISGLDVVHLQCHIGTDTLCLARLGAASVTGLDFSRASLDEARKLADATRGTGGERLQFVQASLYSGLEVLPPATFDLVFTGIGALCWLPSVTKWARVVAGLLKPGGRLFIREAHPVMWAVDEKRSDELVVTNPYFERPEPVLWDEDGTYVETGGHKFTATKSAEFNHGLGEIIQALLSEGLCITGLAEHQSIPWPLIPGQMRPDERGEWSLGDRPWRLPHTYTLQAVKK